MENNLTAKTFHGLKWTYLSVIIIAVTQLIYTGIMARLLDPTIFGLVAMANLVIRFGTYFSRMGIGPALIQKPELSEDNIRAGFTLSIIISLLVSLIIFGLSPLAKIFFNNNDVVPVVQAMAFTLFINGTSTTATSLLRRNFSFQKLSIAETVSFLIGALGVGIPLAYLGFGVWSLVISTMVQGFILTILAFLFSTHSLKIVFSWKQYKPLIFYGGQISIISFIEFINYNLDTMVIGRVMGSALLGIYNRASYLVSLPSQQISTGLTKVLFSSFSSVQKDKEKLREAFSASFLLLGWILFAFCFGISAASKEIVLVVLGSKWSSAIPILQVVALIVPFNLLVSIFGILFDSTGRLRPKLFAIILRLGVLILFFILLSPWGLIGYATAFLFTELLYYCLLTFLSSRLINNFIGDILKNNLLFIGIGIITYVGIWCVTFLLKPFIIQPVFLLLLEIFVAAVLLFFFSFVFPPKRISIVTKLIVSRISTGSSTSKFFSFLLEKINIRVSETG
jgi:O-antigen/teichoic acid export membrane protein